MSIWYPVFPLKQLPAMLGIAATGAVIAGVYGSLHDQVSYTISPEYFTKLKFPQFTYADFGLPNRMFAAEVGFLATWWVGLIAGWILARKGLAELPPRQRPRRVARAFVIIAFVGVASGVAGILLGTFVTRGDDLSHWDDWRQALDIVDLRGFVIAAYLHYASYSGGLLGLLLALFDLRTMP